MIEGKFMTTKEISEWMGISDRSVRRKIKSGTLHAVKVGAIWLVRAPEPQAAWLVPEQPEITKWEV